MLERALRALPGAAPAEMGFGLGCLTGLTFLISSVAVQGLLSIDKEELERGGGSCSCSSDS